MTVDKIPNYIPFGKNFTDILLFIYLNFNQL
nr:MAG TPA: hypothetical protein [Caudoviricetes sp.]DAK52138.1 MAG TPA: hypothetical protein [Caudoviricetes sp.]DAM01298.1 MAG TPA: hypothetical protein [Bacteriophage sp.]DAO98674.1 MAG TPA: hypothetical protein [Herelleviridae sp.]